MPPTLSELPGEVLAIHAAAGTIRAIATVVGGVFLAWLLGKGVRRVVQSWLTGERAILAQRVTFYVVSGLAIASALRELGFDLSVLLGAAGVVTVAVGFASQTSASNVISGVFLIGERPFSVDDWIRIGGTEGQVTSIDLLSVKLRTAENLYVRVPNETAMKSEIINLTRYPIRRLDLVLSVAYKEDLARVKEVLLALCDRNEQILDEPKPLLRFVDFQDSGIAFKLAAWTTTAGYWDMKDSFALEVKAELDRNGIEIPFPHRTLYTGAATEPLPVRLLDGGGR